MLYELFRLRILFAAALITAAFALSACFSPFSGDEGTITVSFGGGGSGRMAVSGAEQESMIHTIILSGPGQTQTETLTGSGGTVTFSGVPAGTWTVTVWGRNETPDVGSAPIHFGDTMLRAWGQETAAVPQAAPVTVRMYPATEVATFNQLQWAFNNAGTGREEIVIITDNIEMESRLSVQSGVSISLVGRNATLSRGLSSQFFAVIGASSVLQLGRSGFGGSLTLDGSYGSGAYDIITSSGTLIMNNNVHIINNTLSDGFAPSANMASAVSIVRGTFTMNGGSIRGNTIGNGGAVAVSGGTAGLPNDRGTFIMNGGIISGNNSTGNTMGAGVYVRRATAANAIGGTFEMNGGTITGNTASPAAINGGGGVYVETDNNPANIENAVFIHRGGTISGNSPDNVVIEP